MGPGPSRLTVLVTFAFLLCFPACREGRGPEPLDRPEGGAPTAPIRISHTAPERVALGEEAEVIVSFTVHAAVEGLRLELREKEGLTLLSQPTFVYGGQAAGASFSETVSVRPDREGTHYLRVLVAGEFGGRPMARTGAVPIRPLGETDRAALETPGEVRTDADGRRVLEVPLPGAKR